MEEEALVEARLALELVSGYVDARTLQATVLERIGSNAESVGRFCETEGAIAELEGRFEEAQEYLDDAQRFSDKAAQCFTEAEGDLNWVIENGDDKSEGWTNLGNLFARQQRSDKAIECYDRRSRLNSKNALAYKNRGSTFLLLKKAPEAERDMRRAVELDGTHPNWYFMLAVALAAQEKADQGIQTLQQAVAHGTVSADVYGSLGTLLAKKERWNEAETALRQSLAINPDSVPSLMNLADLLVKRGRKLEAIDCYRRVLDINPGHRDAQALLEKLRQGGEGS